MYAPYGKHPDPSLLYGLVYAVAAIGALLWLLVLRLVQSRGRSAPILTVVVTTVTAALALLLLVSSEYGAQIFPPLWGILAVLPPAAGILAAVLLRRRSGRAVLRHGQEGSRPMKPSSLVWVSALPGTSTRGPYWPEERITCSICSIPPRS